ncbi:nitric oxide-associated protein 1 [Synchiropus splendidus]|uniref:nitric oxide-associated protein 1 n=1 Tax=Synchiropus splendidus TaxID=270530 RepID=UPI00237E1B6F|nr:nitric oxide-associated protein 1 [Synchiropus splendidus]
MWTGSLCRTLWSAARSARTLSELGSRCLTPGPRSQRTCTVDPNLEERFVFADLTDLKYDPAEDPPPPGPLPSAPPAAPLQRIRSLQRQIKVLQAASQLELQPDSSIQFQDANFPLDPELVASKRKKKRKSQRGEHKIFGTPDADEPLSNTCCSGCGALLHCTSPEVPGYLPSQKYKSLVQEERLDGATCQRCFLLTHHQRALSLQMSPEEYRDVVRQIRNKKALVLLIVDLLDLPASIVPDLPELVGSNKKIVVIGNKIDVLPGDAPNYLQRIKRQLTQYCQDAGFGAQLTDVHLVSAKTGFGIEGLISSLQASWRYKGDVYLVGGANAGKSTLFNTLLESDYCKSRASDVISKATISPWPGTTLNLLRFPIINPTPYRMFRRRERLRSKEELVESEPSKPSRHGYLSGHVGRTFRTGVSRHQDEIDFDPDSLAFGEQEDERVNASAASRSVEQLTLNELKDAHWLYDTPGILKHSDILAVLTDQEVKLLVPTKAIVPRTFVLKTGMSLFVGGVARIDFLQGEKSCWLSVLASAQVPVHVTSLEKADAVYQKHAGRRLLGVPIGDAQRIESFPRLVPQELQLEGRGPLEAAGDITLSSAGWVAVTAAVGELPLLRLHSPEGVHMGLRTPSLLPHIVSLRGERLRKSPAYKTARPTALK